MRPEQICHARRINPRDPSEATTCQVTGCPEEAGIIIEAGGGWNLINISQLRLCREHAVKIAIEVMDLRA